MLYKVTPMMVPASGKEKKAQKAQEGGQPRKRRKSAVYDADGHEVLITLMCLKCRSIKPLAQFGLRKMADGAIRNQPWCRSCRSGTGVPKREKETREETAAPEADSPAELEVEVAVADAETTAPGTPVSEAAGPEATQAGVPEAGSPGVGA